MYYKMSARNSYNVAPIPGDNNGGSGGGGGDGPSADGGVPVGTIVPFAGTTTPVKWLICNGSQVRNDAYPDLLQALGYNFGTAPGVVLQSVVSYSTPTTSTINFSQPTIGNSFIKVGTYLRLSDFTAIAGPNVNGLVVLVDAAPAIGATGNYNATFTTPLPATGNGGVGTLNRYSVPLPDLRLATPVGSQAGTINYGTSGGSATTTLTITNLPPHSHTLWRGGVQATISSVNPDNMGFPNVDTGRAGGGNIYGATDTPTSGSRTQAVGQDGTGQTAFSIRNPYVAMNYIIKAET
jgi:microcystin-dependent protein